MDISKEKLIEFHKNLSAAKIMLHTYKESAFFAYVLYNLHILPDNSIATAGTDGKSIIVNTTFFASLDQQERIFLLLHETLHVCLKHALRKQTRDHRLFNVAADYVINISLQDYGLKMIEGGLIDSKYRDMTTEAVYELLKESNSNRKPDFDDLIEPGSINVPGQNEGEASSDDTNTPLPTPEDISAEIDDILKQAETLSNMSGNDIGKLPADLERYMAELNNPVLPWNQILQQFLHETNRESYNTRRPNRKFFPNFYLPSLHGEGLSRVDFILDTSGSISTDEFTQFVSEVDKVLKQFNPRDIGFSQFDTRYLGTQMINRFSDVTKLEFRGGGGTDISSTLEAVKDFPTKCLIIFTDGYLNTNLPAPKVPVVWCVHGGITNFKPPFGKVINFELE